MTMDRFAEPSALQSREMTVGLIGRLKSLFETSDEPSATRRLDGKSKELLAASIKMLPDGERGWITLKDAAVLFSSVSDEYAFRAMDGGMQNVASFVAEETYRCRFAFIEGRLYFIRTTGELSGMRVSTDSWELRDVRPPWSEAFRRMIDQVPKWH